MGISTQNKCLLSVIIPVHNRPQLIKRSIESVRNQSFKNWELIIVNDNSTDSTVESITPYLNDTRIKLINREINEGAASARNVGITNANGMYISLLDSDDFYHPEFLLRSVAKLEEISDPYIFTYVGVGKPEEFTNNVVAKRIWDVPASFKIRSKPYLYELQVGTAAGISFKRKVFDEIGYFDSNLKAAEDTDYFIRLSEKYIGQPIHEVLVYKDNTLADRLTTNYANNAAAYECIIKKNRVEIEQDIYLRKRWYYKLMRLYLYSGKKKKALLVFLRHVSSLKVLSIRSALTILTGLFLPTSIFIKFYQNAHNWKKS